MQEELTCCHDLGVRFYLLERDECFHANSSGAQVFRFLLARNGDSSHAAKETPVRSSRSREAARV